MKRMSPTVVQLSPPWYRYASNLPGVYTETFDWQMWPYIKCSETATRKWTSALSMTCMLTRKHEWWIMQAILYLDTKHDVWAVYSRMFFSIHYKSYLCSIWNYLQQRIKNLCKYLNSCVYTNVGNAYVTLSGCPSTVESMSLPTTRPSFAISLLNY